MANNVFSPSSALFSQVTIVGVGMMGGSLGLALRARGLAQEVVGVDRSAEVLAHGIAIGALDRGTVELGIGVQNAELILLAAPVDVIPTLLEKLESVAGPDTLISDIGSTKGRIVAMGERLFGTRFVGGHPMTGSPYGGIEAAQPDLFVDAAWAVVRSQLPERENQALPAPPDALTAPNHDTSMHQIVALVRALGSRPILLDSAEHDRLVALISHLPHLLSFAFADTIAASADPDAARQMAGGSYRDMMRVSEADRTFWKAIFLENRTALLQALDAYEYQLKSLRHLLEPDA